MDSEQQYERVIDTLESLRRKAVGNNEMGVATDLTFAIGYVRVLHKHQDDEEFEKCADLAQELLVKES